MTEDSPDFVPLPLEEQIRCAERELWKRKEFYPRWVKAGKMSQEKSDREICGMKSIVKTLKNVKEPLLL